MTQQYLVKHFINYFERGYLDPDNAKFMRKPYVPKKDYRGKYLGNLDANSDIFFYFKDIYELKTILNDMDWMQYDFCFLDFCIKEGLTQTLNKEEFNQACKRIGTDKRCYGKEYVVALITDKHHEFTIKNLLKKFYKYCVQMVIDNEWVETN